VSTVYLIRHGQAQQKATTEAEYDRLTDLGHTQAGWLGDWMAGSNHAVSRVVSGAMQRQRQTAGYIAQALGLEVAVDPRLNEIDYFSLAASMQARYASPEPEGRAQFLDHFPRVMEAWSEAHISCPAETFADYETRVEAALAEAEGQPGTVLVTSGGIIGMAMRHVLGLSLHAFSSVLLQVCNSSLTSYSVEAGARRLNEFNATPHLDPAGRAGTRTFI